MEHEDEEDRGNSIPDQDSLPAAEGLAEKKCPATDAKEVGVGDPAEEKTFCHRTIIGLPQSRMGDKAFVWAMTVRQLAFVGLPAISVDF